jgi:hypothetical protein
MVFDMRAQPIQFYSLSSFLVAFGFAFAIHFRSSRNTILSSLALAWW